MARGEVNSRLALIFTCALLLPFCCVVQGRAGDSATTSNPSFSDIQFKATHNSYRCPDLPSVQITKYNVWEIELDFGVLPDSPEFVVGHDGPEPKAGLRTLQDWILDIREAMSEIAHPIILKLEAKTKDTSGPFTKRRWTSADEWGNWQARLRDDLIDWLGEDICLTRAKFEADYASVWPSIEELAGKVIITLQDNNNNRDIDTGTEWFFIGDVPGLTAAWPEGHPIHNPTEFGRAVKSGANRLIMDNEYREPWSNIFVHPPVPCYVCPTFSGPQWGTMAYPFKSVAHALNANWTYSGLPLTGQAVILPDNCTSAVNEDSRITIHSGSVIEPPLEERIVYMIAFSIQDVQQAQTDDSIWYVIEGEKRKMSEILFDKPENNPARAGIGLSWYASDDLGFLKKITVRVAGDDDLAVERIIITCSSGKRYVADVSCWIGEDHGNPVTIPLLTGDQ